MPSIALPQNMTFYDWASTLLTDFSTEEIPIPPKDEKGWQAWAQRVYARNLFNNDAVPSPLFYDNWRIWAELTAGAVNG